MSEVETSRFDLTLQGCNTFGGDQPTYAWIGIDPCAPLLQFQKKLAHRFRQEKWPIEARKYVPHVTIANVKQCDPTSVMHFTTRHSLFRLGPIPIEAFHLYESIKGGAENHYEIIASFAFNGGTTNPSTPIRFGRP